MYILYGGKETRALITEMVMAEGGIDYELIEVDLARGEHRATAFLEMNPAGRVPVLKTPDGEILHETPAINLYLCERHGLDLAPAPGDPDRGRFLGACFYITDELEAAMKRYFFPYRYADGESHAPAVRERATTHARNCLKVIDARLEPDGPYHLGGRICLADLMLTYWCMVFEEDCLDGLPRVARLVDAVKNRPKLETLIRQYEES